MTTTTPSIPVPAVPVRARAWLYFGAWLLNTFGQLGAVIWVAIAAASPDVSMPLWLAIGSPALAFITGQLHALAGGNLPSTT